MQNLQNIINYLRSKRPEEVALYFYYRNINIDSLIESKVNDKSIKELIELVEICLNTNSLTECLAREFVPKLLKSNFWKKYIFDYFSKKIRSYSESLLFTRCIINICHSILKLNVTELDNLHSLISKLDTFVKYELNNLNLLNHYNYGLAKLINKTNHCKGNEDFTRLSILPQISDILVDKKLVLNKNLLYGSYPNVHNYLDTQFRLLREDFLQPLRNGIEKFRIIIRENKIYENQQLSNEIRYKIKRIESLNAYFNVKIVNNICTDHGVVYTIQLDSSSRSKINWELSKKLIFGSLICLSSDFYFKECLIGTVCNRDSDALINQGLVQIKFNIEFNKSVNGRLNFPVLNKTYVMLETTAFFESYKHVLHALVSFGLSSELEFPFRENIVDARNSNMQRPEYLKNAIIDFRPLVDGKKIQKINKNGFFEYEFSNDSFYAKNCSVSKPSEWPSAELMGLDESQYDAVKLALENKLALIQGPPGTGKTYIGVKLVQLLVHNKNLWWHLPGEQKRPILMVCYTNHALDQFLEYCINVCKLNQGVVRVGSRCKNTNLNSFLLSNLKKDHKYDKTILQAIKYENFKLRDLKVKLEKLNTLLNEIDLKNGLVSFNLIKKYIHINHLKQLDGHNKKMENYENRTAFDYTMLEWLGVFDIDTELTHVDSFSTHKNYLNDNLEQPDKSILMFDYENQYLNNERMLEEDFEFEKLVFQEKKKFHSLIEYDEIANMSFYFNEFSFTDSVSGNEFLKKKQKFISNKNIALIREHFQSLNKFNEGRTNFHLDENHNIWRLNINERFALYLTWLNKLRIEKQSDLENLAKQFNNCTSILQEIRMQKDKSVLQNALIIAMTTTGSSRYHKILKDIGPRIVIVEEAAEVFEAHIVSSLSKNCEHLILIGDHAQLRPNPAVYNLAINYHLDVSLFERLLNNKAKKVMLKTQHRMRPEISLLMKHFYEKKILDHSSVEKFESIRGVNSKNIFFINHSKSETKHSESLSKSNSYEALYLTKFCQYLIKQKYMSSQITILTMYLGQAGEIRNLLRIHNLVDIKVSTVDNFQGEENDIILLSLVRSNTLGKIGFLNIHNRVCVALSRARQGLFCIGNLDFLSLHSDKWANIIENLKQLNCVGTGIKLTCFHHPENDLIAIEPQDFDKRIDGGCFLKCDFKLKCGHNCSNYCHCNNDPEHLNFQCTKPCEKINPKCGHKCTKLCYQTDDCNSCKFKIEKLVPECGHIIKLYCNTEPLKSFCYIPCNFILKCGHTCSKVCAKHLNINDHELSCSVQIQIETPCVHKTKFLVACSEKKWNLEKLCNKPCATLLDCGHQCNKLCGECFSGRVHQKCDQIISREMPCGHMSSIECWRRFEPCFKGTLKRCNHKIFEQSCYLPRSICKNTCINSCDHFKCNNACSDLCDHPPCNEPCNKFLKCGHKCIGICGEPCPRLCRTCDRTKVTKIYFGNERSEKAKFVLLFDCKHLFESTGLDNWIKKHTLNSTPVCPKCKTPICSTLRYLNLVKQQYTKIDELKTIEYGNYEENMTEQLNFLNEIENYTLANSAHGPFDFKFISEFFSILNIRRLTRKELTAIKNCFCLFRNFFDLKSKFKFNDNSHVNYEIQKIEQLIWDSNKQRPIFYCEDQNFYEILNEIKRADYIFKFYSLNDFFLREEIFYPLQTRHQVYGLISQIENFFFKFGNAFQANDRVLIVEKINLLESLLLSSKNDLISSSKQIIDLNLNGECIHKL